MQLNFNKIEGGSQYLCEDGIEKPVPCERRKRRSLGRLFISHPQKMQKQLNFNKTEGGSQTKNRPQYAYMSSSMKLRNNLEKILPNYVFIFYNEMNHGMRFPTMWYVRPARAQTSLRVRAVRS